MATTRRDGWAENARGLNPSDLAMHVVLPELDGRILAGAISFKQARTDGGISLVNRRRIVSSRWQTASLNFCG
jgi:cobaltochelatase CobN